MKTLALVTLMLLGTATVVTAENCPNGKTYPCRTGNRHSGTRARSILDISA